MKSIKWTFYGIIILIVFLLLMNVLEVAKTLEAANNIRTTKITTQLENIP
jgi:hypothetical protein